MLLLFPAPVISCSVDCLVVQLLRSHMRGKLASGRLFRSFYTKMLRRSCTVAEETGLWAIGVNDMVSKDGDHMLGKWAVGSCKTTYAKCAPLLFHCGEGRRKQPHSVAAAAWVYMQWMYSKSGIWELVEEFWEWKVSPNIPMWVLQLSSVGAEWELKEGVQLQLTLV